MVELNQNLIQKLRNGEIAVKNEEPLGILRQILDEAFPVDYRGTVGTTGGGYYYMLPCNNKYWAWGITENLYKTLNVKDFIIENKTIIGYKAPYNIPEWMLWEGEIIESKTLNVDHYPRLGFNIPKSVVESWEPVYEEYKVGDYVVVKSYKQCGEGNGVEEDNLISKLYDVDTDSASGMFREEGDFCVKDTAGWYKRIRKSHIIRKATQEEIDSFRKEVINMGSFNLTVKGGKCFHRNEDISDFVEGVYETFANTSYHFGKNNYLAKIKDVTFSETGCENSETKLTDWVKVYKAMKK